MSKSIEELNSLKEEVEAVSKKLAELTEEELTQVTGGAGRRLDYVKCPACRAVVHKTGGVHKCPNCGHKLAARVHYSQ